MAASQSAIRAGEAYVEATLRDLSFSRGLDRIKSKFVAISRSMRELTMIGLATGAALLPVISTFLKFDDAILKMKAFTDGTNAEFDRLEQLTRSLGRSTSFTATEVAGLMTELGKAGFTRQQIEGMTESVLNLARASGTEAALSAEILGSTIRQFSLDATNAAKVADLLAATANKSSVSVQDIGYSMQYAGKVASDMGSSLEDTLALVGVLGNFSIKGEAAGTTLRRLFTVVTSGGKEIKQVFGNSIEVADIAGNPRKLIDIMRDIENATKGLTGVERVSKFKEFFDLLGITGASVLARGTMDVDAFRAALNNVDGTAAAAAKEMDSGIGGAWRRTKATAEAVAIAVGESLAPALAGVAIIFAQGAEWLMKWIKENKELAQNIGIVVVGILALIATGTGILAVGMIFTGMWSAVMLVVGAIKLLAITLVVIAATAAVVATLGAAFIGFFAIFGQGSRVWADIQSGFTGLMDTVREVGAIFGEVFDGIKRAVQLGDIAKAGKIAMLGLEAVWLSIWAQLLTEWYKFSNAFTDAFDNVAISIKVAMLDALKWITAQFIKAYSTIVQPILESLAIAGIITVERVDKMTVRVDNARKEIDDIHKEAVKGVQREAADERGLRGTTQKTEVGRIISNRDMVRNFMNNLREGMAVAEAPMPREVEDLELRSDVRPLMPSQLGLEAKFGDSARGTFQSGDFQGALGIGGANKFAEAQLQKLENIHGTLQNIEGKVGNNTFE